MKILKRISTLLIALFMVMGTSSYKVNAQIQDEVVPTSSPEVNNSFTDELSNSDVTITIYTEKDEHSFDGESDYLVQSMTRGLDRPTEFYDLLKNTRYRYVLGENCVSVYTNYYFKPSYMNEISIDISNITTSGMGSWINNGKVTVSLYDYSTDTKVTSWTGIPGTDAIGVGFNNLNSSKYYYFRFENSTNYFTGYGYIHHHYVQ